MQPYAAGNIGGNNGRFVDLSLHVIYLNRVFDTHPIRQEIG